MTFAAIIVKNLQQRPARSVLTIAGIAIGIAAVITLASIAWGFENAWVRIYTARGTDLIVTKGGSLSPVAASFPLTAARELRSFPEVAETSGMLSDVMSIEETPIVLVFGWERNTFVWDHLRLVQGRWPADDSEATVVIGTMAAEMLGKSVGSPIQIGTSTFAVSGIFRSAAFAENGAVVMTLPQLQRLAGHPGDVNFVNVKLASGVTPDRADTLRRSMAARLPGFKVVSAREVADDNAAIQIVKAMSWSTAAIALAVGAVAVMNTVLMSVFERMQEIGILLAVGWRRRRVVAMILYESIVLSLAGGIVGSAVGTVAVKLFEITPLLRGKLEGEFSVSLFALAFMISIALGVMGGLYPAYRGSRLRPSDALKYE